MALRHCELGVLPSNESNELAPGDSALKSDDYGELVRQLNGICRASSPELALRVGGVIPHHSYSGDTDGWRARGPKTHSFRRLAEHPGLMLSAGALCRCLANFELCERTRAPSRWRRLGASHLRAVIGIRYLRECDSVIGSIAACEPHELDSLDDNLPVLRQTAAVVDRLTQALELQCSDSKELAPERQDT